MAASGAQANTNDVRRGGCLITATLAWQSLSIHPLEPSSMGVIRTVNQDLLKPLLIIIPNFFKHLAQGGESN